MSDGESSGKFMVLEGNEHAETQVHLNQQSKYQYAREPSVHLELILRPDAREVPGARREALRMCEDAGFCADACAALDLALGEALANAVVHGSHPSDDALPHSGKGEVHVSVWDYQSQLIVQVQDSGAGFDPPTPPYVMPEPDLNATHGRGLPLMELLTDALVVCRGDASEGGASIFLVKKHGKRHV